MSAPDHPTFWQLNILYIVWEWQQEKKKPMHMSTDTVLLLLLGIVGFMYVNPIKAQRVFGAFVLFWFVVSEYIQCRVDSIHRCEAGRGCDSFQLLYTKILQHNQKLFAICPCYDPILHFFYLCDMDGCFVYIYICVLTMCIPGAHRSQTRMLVINTCVAS